MNMKRNVSCGVELRGYKRSQRNLFGGLATKQASNLVFVIDGIKTRGKIINSEHIPCNDDNVISTRNERKKLWSRQRP